MLQILKKIFPRPNQSALSETIKNGAFLVDVRTAGEFASGSVKGAVNIPLDQLPKQLDKFKNKTNTIVFCKSGSRSSHAKRILEQNGVHNVTNGGSWYKVQAAQSEN